MRGPLLCNGFTNPARGPGYQGDLAGQIKKIQKNTSINSKE
jgi:hypothetical protein